MAGIPVNARYPRSPPLFYYDRGHITVDLSKELDNIFVGGGSNNRGNYGFWELFHYLFHLGGHGGMWGADG